MYLILSHTLRSDTRLTNIARNLGNLHNAAGASDDVTPHSTPGFHIASCPPSEEAFFTAKFAKTGSRSYTRRSCRNAEGYASRNEGPAGQLLLCEGACNHSILCAISGLFIVFITQNLACIRRWHKRCLHSKTL